MLSSAWSRLRNVRCRRPDGDVSIVFGGSAAGLSSKTLSPSYPVHACPARLAMGAILGILAALLDAGRIERCPPPDRKDQRLAEHRPARSVKWCMSISANAAWAAVRAVGALRVPCP